MIKLLQILFFSSFMLLNGCSSIVNGSTEAMSIVAIPATATITLKTGKGVTVTQQTGSLSYDLKRSTDWFDGAEYKLEVTSKGYEKQTIIIEPTVSGWYIGGNLFSGGLLGWLVIDPATGGMWILQPNNGQEIDNLRVTLAANIPTDTLAKATQIQ
ncbi:hypothetical protein L4D09_12585 [Photobacterium makurazakiensis]|uniref:hypothetical protein n=1 Tax=Photobacterium makurazakiensis TaxID=2910234 RepID=UPI003D0F9B15